ncbi:MAG: hypothetical protein AMJ54_06195 [Deltaproteobacteria bacterium SG8_13]|nr:MAG: hypothetical protein AMJ54_06195 [Deltaproteobacteria bacterium SG8_13]
MLQPNQSADLERRKDPRHPFSRYVFFATPARLYEGDLVNYSLGGIFIQSPDIPPVGEVIIVALPYSKDKNDKRKGQVVWRNREGFGVEFFKDPRKRVMRVQTM